MEEEIASFTRFEENNYDDSEESDLVIQLLAENEELKQQLKAGKPTLAEVPKPFKPGWVRVTANRAAEIVTSERHCPLDPQPPVTVARLSKMSATTLEKYGLRRVRGSYEFYQKVDSGSGFLPIIPEEAI